MSKPGRYTLRQKEIGKETPIRTDEKQKISTGDKFQFIFKGQPAVYETTMVDKGRERAFLQRENSEHGTWFSYNEISRRTKIYLDHLKQAAA